MIGKKEEFEERAAILQFCPGNHMTREQAEKIAAKQIGLSDDEAGFLIGAKNDSDESRDTVRRNKTRR